ncbi:pseudouridine synthase [Melaminivora suipulveris]|uniref:Dual-specificity RNA pseudouridine synthase RluF n=1 Tax=Melaminivora suipulveris TaxID=2109913 RepID=A0A2R3QAZ6_9BURK|nr:pseudouridine synthase [Melaminivora suipulveris]AVO48929.1 pseudouridine synthase [Melaminivora suipulveris]
MSDRPPRSPSAPDAARPRLTLRHPGGPAAPAPRPAARPAPPRPPAPRPNVARADAPRQAPAARPDTPQALQRLNKRMAELGLCSRREADAWIERGWVRVDGQVAVMGQQVAAHAHIDIDRAAQGQQREQVTIVLHKPMGYVSGQAEDGHTPAVALIGPRTHWAGDASRTRFSPAQLRGLAPCGRLDIDSVGLLVLTQDGRVARQLIGEDSTIDKEYLVRVQYGDVAQEVRTAFPAQQLERLRHGLSLDGQPLKPAQVEWQNAEQLRFVLTEGKKRQIRRMCEQVGLKVVGLKRIRIGRVLLGQLPVGQWRYLGPGERF